MSTTIQPNHTRATYTAEARQVPGTDDTLVSVTIHDGGHTTRLVLTAEHWAAMAGVVAHAFTTNHHLQAVK